MEIASRLGEAVVARAARISFGTTEAKRQTGTHRWRLDERVSHPRSKSATGRGVLDALLRDDLRLFARQKAEKATYLQSSAAPLMLWILQLTQRRGPDSSDLVALSSRHIRHQRAGGLDFEAQPLRVHIETIRPSWRTVLKGYAREVRGIE